MSGAARTCVMVGCDGAPHGQGYCRPHYNRLYRHGDPQWSREKNWPSLAERFEAKVHKAESGCWEWQGTRDRGGYGALYVRVDGKSRGLRAHRVSYELTVGQIPEGLVIDHLCRNRGCVNPEHLEPVTPQENVIRGNISRANGWCRIASERLTQKEEVGASGDDQSSFSSP